MSGERLVMTLEQGGNVRQGSLAFALAFEHAAGQGPFIAGQTAPGAANERLADWLVQRAGSFQKILTQEALLDALGKLVGAPVAPPGKEPALQINGADVHRMHGHDRKMPVRSLGSLFFSVDRLQDHAFDSVVLVAHHAMFLRALVDLDFVLRMRRPGAKITICDPAIYPVPYAAPADLTSAMRWAWREQNRAAPAEFAQRAMLKVPLLRRLILKKVCPSGVRLPPIGSPPVFAQPPAP